METKGNNVEKELTDSKHLSVSNIKLSPSTSSKAKLGTQKLNWIPSPEKETYRTVVVNYRYAKMDKNYSRNTGAISKKKHLNRKVAMAAKQSGDEEVEDDEDVPDLRKLYECSKEELRTFKSADTPKLSFENITDKRQTPAKEAIKLEMYCLPREQEAIIEEPQINTIEECEIETATLQGDINNEYETKSQEYTDEYDTSKMSANHPSFSDFVFLGDNEIGETPDFDADCCCAIAKDKVDGTQQTCIIKNTTKGTQKPERHNEQLQTHKKVTVYETKTADQPTDENGLQLAIAEIPKDGGKSKSTPSPGGFRQRQQELHRYRIAVEQKRLELLEVKLQRERDEMLREQILFEKDIEFKTSQLRQLNEDKFADIM
ncbi:uncharacterized protein LOC105665449 [Ceratitis capitata]|uniref:uncharacterized protein LOC105665449 n=1 Tax=Ceratitis capitata TaxID=7213 RepID=UPI00061892D2|nr:uncharacterized protein LOC105665449 [Ceratitis capitata]